jgi:HPt (histidine-containing phosphotransfer) domain-containing protein
MSEAAFRHINLEYLENMTEGDSETMITMLEMLIFEIPDEIGKMYDCVKAKDWKELFMISHKMKTTLGFVGNEKMTLLNKQLEHNARNEENIENIPSMVDKFYQLSLPVIEELKQACN